MVRRLKCTRCDRIHTELPYEVVPYKHYMRTVIEDVLDGVVDEKDPAAASGPSDLTMWRWRRDRDKKDRDKKDSNKKDRDKIQNE